MEMRPRAYAEGTTVPVEKSRADIERLLSRHGADQLGLISDTERGIAFVLFTIVGWENLGFCQLSARLILAGLALRHPNQFGCEPGDDLV
jgi:hypothetical protein